MPALSISFKDSEYNRLLRFAEQSGKPDNQKITAFIKAELLKLADEASKPITSSLPSVDPEVSTQWDFEGIPDNT